MAEEFKFDVFLSFHPKDVQVVRGLAERLKAKGLKIWFDEWELQAGENKETKTQDGLKSSRVQILFVSKNALGGTWQVLEDRTFPFRDTTNNERRFIPVLIDNAPIPEAINKFAFINWQKFTKKEFARLLAASKKPTPIEVPERESRDEVVFSILEVLVNHPTCIVISQDGKTAFSGNLHGEIRRWDLKTGQARGSFGDRGAPIDGLAITADNRLAITGRYDGGLCFWDLLEGTLAFTIKAHKGYIKACAITPDGKRAVSGSSDKTVRVWDVQSKALIADLVHRCAQVTGVAISSNGHRVISCYKDYRVLYVWDLNKENPQTILRGHDDEISSFLRGHQGEISSIAISSDGKRAVSGGSDKTILVWDLERKQLLATLEGHTKGIRCLAMASDGNIAISSADDNSISIWDLQGYERIGVLEGHTSKIVALSINTYGTHIISNSEDGEVRVWIVQLKKRVSDVSLRTSVYTNAKVLLVGDSGVGKTGLAHRLTQDVFQHTASTDGVWATQLKLPNTYSKQGVEREIWLWDFAGQADYRLIHQLYMDEAALSVLVFNPQSENPFEGLGQWDRDLQRAARRQFKKLLVAGRCDRGGLMISQDSIERFKKERAYDDYIETSALTGKGCDTLRKAIIRKIPWDDIPWTASPRIFKLLKDAIIKIKDEGTTLLRLGELKQQLELRLPGEVFTMEQLRAVVGLLAGPGVVWQVEFGDFVILQSEKINAYAAAVVRSVRAHYEEIGCIPEEDVLAGKLNYQDMNRLPAKEEQIVLRAMHQAFVDHGLCLREHAEKGTLLIFPSYFRRERPELGGHPVVIVTYQFNGPLDEIYATLVVRLHHTATFDKDRLWRFAADFKTPGGKRLGIKMSKKAEGSAELEVYFEAGISDDMQVTFIRYVHEHLMLKARDVVRLRHYICPHCGLGVENRRAIEERLKKGMIDILCVSCEKRVPLWDLIEKKFASQEFQQKAHALQELTKTAIDNESRELILVGHTYAIVGEAGQIYRQYTNSDHGIDGEIEFKNQAGQASGKRLYLQLKSGDSYLNKRKKDGTEVFTIKNQRHATYWKDQAYPVMLVVRTSDGAIRWMDVSAYLRRNSTNIKKTKAIAFDGESLTALNLRKMRDLIFSSSL